MNRLRLIKPWHLRTVHQRLELVSNQGAEFSFIPCSGPKGDYTQHTSLRTGTSIVSGNKHDHAPVSDVIFAFGNNNIR